MADRSERRERRLLDAKFPIIKHLEDFQFADNPNVPQATIATLAQCGWIDDREVVIFIGESGTGKTMLATALGVCACQQGRRVKFTTLAALANELQEADSRRELTRVVGRYARIELLIIDELGFIALPEGAAELVFQVISERNERAALAITTSLPFGEWTKVFPDPRLAKAVVDRLTHRAHIIETGTESSALPPRPPTPPHPTQGDHLTHPHRTRRPPSSPLRLAPRGSPPRRRRRHPHTDATRSNNTTTRRQVGPIERAAPGPLQVAVLICSLVRVSVHEGLG